MNKKTENKAVSPWQWVPSLYFAQGLPYVVVMSVAVILFKRMGMSNTDIALYTSGLNLPWVIKPLWSPLVDLLKTKRWWIVVMQILVGAGLAGIALTIQGPLAFRYCLAFMWLLAFSSATHDIAADGFYMLGLNEKKQAYFVGIRSTFYRFAVIFGQGILVMFAGWLEQRYAREMPETAAIPQAWSLTFYLLTILFALLFVYHYLFLPHPRRDTCTLPPQQASAGRVFKEFLGTFTSFLPKETHRQCPDLHPALSVRRSAVGENHFSLPAGYSGYRRACPIYGRSRLYLWYDRRHRPDDRRNCRRNRYGTAGIEVLPMDHDHCHEPAQYRVSVSLFRPTGKYRNHIGLRRHRTIRLWFRIHFPHLFYDAIQQRQTPNRPLCDLYRFHGFRPDAPRYDIGLDRRIDRLPGFFRLDHAVYDTQFLGYPSGQKKLNR